MVFMDRPSYKLSIFSAGLYGALSLLMTLLNKVVITRFFFDFPIVIMMLQMAVALFTLEMARICGLLKIAPYTFDRGKDMLVPSILYSLHSYFSLTALEGMNLPMYAAVKRCVPILNLYLATVVLKKPRPSRGTVISVAIISIGTFIASAHDDLLDGWSYMYGALSVVCQAAYLTWIEKLSLTTQYSPIELMYMNSFNGLTIFLIADMIQDEIRDAFMYFLTSASNMFIMSFVLLLLAGALLNFALFLCTAHNSALATSIIGNIKAVVTTIIGYIMGFFIFFDVVPQMYNIFGVCMNIFGCLMYTYSRARETGLDTRRIVELNPSRL